MNIEAVCGGVPRITAIGRIRYNAGAPVWTGFGVSAVADTGTGDALLTLEHPVDATQRVVMITLNSVTADRCKGIGFASPADNTLQIVAQLEAANGAAPSANTDLDYDVVVWQVSRG